MWAQEARAKTLEYFAGELYYMFMHLEEQAAQILEFCDLLLGEGVAGVPDGQIRLRK